MQQPTMGGRGDGGWWLQSHRLMGDTQQLAGANKNERQQEGEVEGRASWGV